jgi:mono/diheme cytochrome c family protein
VKRRTRSDDRSTSGVVETAPEVVRTAPRLVPGALVAAAALASSLGSALARDDEHEGKPLPPAAGRAVEYERDVAPIFESHCYSCHGPKRRRSDFRLDVKASALAGGQIGVAIVPGDSAGSPLVRYVAGADAKIHMPPRDEPLSSDDVGVIRRWIDDGARWPETRTDEKGSGDGRAAEPSRHWAYQPIVRPPIPTTRAAQWVRSPVDAFLLAKLEERGLAFAPPADRTTLLRRVSFDLTGLPPTLAELDAFLADERPDAYERVVDRLLASPRYGERQTRRWMDLVHFAETHGNDQDRPRPNAWPYRDWLIGAWNGDLPYARFVESQLAADVLFPDEPAAVAALGFLAAGPWDESSQLNILEETIDKQVARNLDRDDMLTTTASTFLSSTVHCARCHDHKFDPIAQRDYYRLQSVFAGVDRAERPFDLDPELHAKRQEILKRKLELERAPADSPLLHGAEIEGDVAAWERGLTGVGAPWTVLALASVESTGGATVTLRDDGSVVFSGELPEVDRYVVTAPTTLRTVTALRVDLLPDETLPFHGPGRQDNGNLHLSELTMSASPADVPWVAAPLAFAAASADFDQEGWTAAMAIDGKLETAWGIYPQVGRAHHAVFELAEPLDVAASGPTLTIRLDQLHGRHHLIGRLRLAVTDAPRPIRATTTPEPVRAILATAAEQRTPAQVAELARHRRLSLVEAELAALPPPRLVYAGTTDFAPQDHFTPARGVRPVRVLARGDVARPLEAVAPAGLACLVGFDAKLALCDADVDDEGARRAALARWIVDPRNALTWRSAVNRVWQDHFGRGIVATPSDFGTMGAAPSHPQLLDWLASWFQESGGSRKALDRLIVTSAAYRQSTRFDARVAELDPDDAWLGRMRRSRLEAEELRDAMLAIAGELDLTMGGPSVKQFVESPGIHVTPKVDYDAFDVERPEMRRRSVYRFLFRTLPDPFMDSLDCPDASQLAPTRSSSVTALQALSLLNDRFVVAESEHLAKRVEEDVAAAAAAVAADATLAADVVELHRRVLLRPPTAAERDELVRFAAKHGLANAARLLFNSHEFVFVN